MQWNPYATYQSIYAFYKQAESQKNGLIFWPYPFLSVYTFIKINIPK